MLNPEYNVCSYEFWKMWGSKLVRTLLSVKLWVMISITWLSTSLLKTNLINGTQWTAVIISGVVAIVLSRTAFQMASLKNGKEKEGDNE